MTIPANSSPQEISQTAATDLARIVVYGNPKIPDVLNVHRQLCEWASRRGGVSLVTTRDVAQMDDGFSPPMEGSFYEIVQADSGDGTVRPLDTPFAPEFQSRSIVLCLGGDGTLLHALHTLWPITVPLAGVRMGSLSFNSAVSPERLPEFLETWLNGELHVSRRLVLGVRVIRNSEIIATKECINDVVLRQAGSRLINLTLRHGGQLVSRFKGDGLIVSTPTGSTAYNLSAGGPIVYPDMNAIIATAICPHTLAFRPVVLPTEPPVTMEFNAHHGRNEAVLLIDGQETLPVMEGDIVSISAEPMTMQVAVDPLEPYFARLRRKLSWSGDLPQSN